MQVRCFIRNNFCSNLRFSQNKTTTSNNRTRDLIKHILISHNNILHTKKVEEVSLVDNDRYIDESKDILKSILNDVLSTDSDGAVVHDTLILCWKKVF